MTPASKNLDAAQQKLALDATPAASWKSIVQNLEAKRKLVEVAQASSDSCSTTANWPAPRS